MAADTMRIAAVMIARNEAACIRRALDSVRWADEIIVLDTGSTDATKEIAAIAGAKVFERPWDDDFAAARNAALEHVPKGIDWIVSIDADHQLLTPRENVVAELQKAEKEGQQACLARARYPGGQEHWFGVLFRPHVRWVGEVHEHLTVATSFQADVTYSIDESKAKAADPDRNLRILRFKSDLTKPRNRFYIAREYADRNMHEQAIEWMRAYLAAPAWWVEVCEAHLTIAKAAWQLKQGDLARAHIIQAIAQNPDCKEALVLAAEYHAEPWRSKWAYIAQSATNKDVLFTRVQ